MKRTAELNCTTVTQHTLSVVLREVPTAAPEDKVIIEVIIYPGPYAHTSVRPIVKRITLSPRDMEAIATLE